MLPHRLALVLAFACLTLPFLMILAIMTPPGEVPDEPAHLARADSLRQGQLVGHRATPAEAEGGPWPSAGLRAHSGLIATGFFLHPGETMGRAAQERAAARGWGHPVYLHAPNTAVYGPAFYLPAALTLEIAQRTGVAPYHAILAARLVNVAFYIGLGAAALGLARRGRLVMLFTLAVPMSLSLAASLNQDGLIIATGALVAALLTRIEPGAGFRGLTWIAAGLLTAMLMAKPVYLPLAATLLLPAAGLPHAAPGPAWRLADHRDRIATFGLVVALAMAWAGYNAAFVAVPFALPNHATGPLAATPMLLHATDPGLQLQVLLAEPIRFLSIPFDTIQAKLGLWWWQLVGALGSNDLLFSQRFYRAWTVIACLTLAASLALAPWRRPGAKATLDSTLIGLIGLLCLWLILVGQYLSWTHVGETLVSGVQGRYFLPLLPFLALALPQPRSCQAESCAGLAWTPIILFSGSASISLILAVYCIA